MIIFALYFSNMSDVYEFTLASVNPSVFSPMFYSPELGFYEYSDDDKPTYYTFGSAHLDALTDPIEVWAKGKFLLALFKGAHIITYEPVYGNYQANSLNLLRLFKGDSDVTPNNTFAIAPSQQFGQVIASPNSTSQVWMESHPISGMLAAARNDVKAQNILLQIGFGIDWVNLYSILDSIRYYSGQEGFKQILTEAELTREDVNAFTGTVNNFGLLSIAARHGDLGGGTPSKTVNLDQARFIVLRLARAYFKVNHQI